MSNLMNLEQHENQHRSTYEDVFEHLNNCKYKNMHLREACQIDKQRCLRYLHIVRIKPDSSVVEGHISGPEINACYELLPNDVIRFLELSGSKKNKIRIQNCLLKELNNRVNQEKNEGKHFPKRKKSQLYLSRWKEGMPADHEKCNQARAQGLSNTFLSKLMPWKFRLIIP